MSDKWVIPGFPRAVTTEIEVPNMAELLMYPMFAVAEAETVRKYGTEFQRMLLDKLPLKNNRKHVTVYSSVHIVSKHMRPITTFSQKSERGVEWHVDGYEKYTHDHYEPYETVYLLLSGASCPTDFNTAPMFIPKDSEVGRMNRIEFNNYIKHRIEHYQPIENNRIYEFSNHIHRAVMPDGPEFRYTFRVRETDRDDIPPLNGQILKNNRYFDIHTQDWKNNITQQGDSVTISYPREWLNH